MGRCFKWPDREMSGEVTAASRASRIAASLAPTVDVIALWEHGLPEKRSGRRRRLRARNEMLLRSTACDQARDVIELLRILIDEAERQLQPVAVRLLLERNNGVQVAI